MLWVDRGNHHFSLAKHGQTLCGLLRGFLVRAAEIDTAVACSVAPLKRGVRLAGELF